MLEKERKIERVRESRESLRENLREEREREFERTKVVLVSCKIREGDACLIQQWSRDTIVVGVANCAETLGTVRQSFCVCNGVGEPRLNLRDSRRKGAIEQTCSRETTECVVEEAMGRSVKAPTRAHEGDDQLRVSAVNVLCVNDSSK